MRTEDSVPEVSNHGVDHKGLTVGIEVGAPGVGHAVHHLFDHTATGVIPPDTCIDLNPLGVGCPRPANCAGALNTVPAPEPAIWPPRQSVRGRVPHTVLIQAIQHHLRRTVRHEIVVGIGDKKHLRQIDHPDTA